jgi:hypothetical protein
MDIILFISSVLITFMYFISGISKMNTFNTKVVLLKGRFKKMVTSQNVPIWFFQLAIIGVIILQLCGSLIITLYALIKNNRNVQFHKIKNIFRYLAIISCVLLFIFTIMATYLFHFPPIGNNYYATLSNINACGSFILLGYFILKIKN